MVQPSASYNATLEGKSEVTMRALASLLWTIVGLVVLLSVFRVDPHAARASALLVWQQDPAAASIKACNQASFDCPAEPLATNEFWLDGVVISEVLSNQIDLHGLGAYQLHVVYDPTIFQQPTFSDAGIVGDAGVRSTACGAMVARPGDVTFICYSSGPFGVGASWTGPRVIARLTLVLESGVFSRLGSASTAANTSVFAGGVVTNTCGQPLNDGSIQPIPGQDDCQGNLLPGLQPGGIVATINPSTLDVTQASDRLLVGDINGDCAVNGIDLSLMAQHYLTGIGSPLYGFQYDLNQDGAINSLDLQALAAHFTEHC